MKHSEFSGNFLGIVVQNNDPECRGRVKVFVPHVNVSVYKGWTEIKKDKRFKFLGLNVGSDLSDILQDLKIVLPWADCAAPLVGESSSGRYNSSQSIGTISDSNKVDTLVSNNSSAEVDTTKLTIYSQNLDSIGEKLGNKYDIDFYRVNDAFTSATSGVNCVNKYSYNYIPETYSNQAHGAFAIPSVGAHVWIFFQDGDPMTPVYFAASFSETDWRGIYDVNTVKGIDYPGEFENTTLSGKDAATLSTETYRNKYVVNQKGGTIQIVNTDNREVLKFTHFSGSFKEFTNFTNIEFAQNNDQKLVLGDQFSTIRGNRNEFTQHDFDDIVRGNRYVKVGDLNPEVFRQWKSMYKSVADVKQLFDIQRTNTYNHNGINFTSPTQTRKGSFAPCPVCQGNVSKYWRLNGKAGETGIATTTSEGDGSFLFGNVTNALMQEPANFTTAGSRGTIFGETCPSCQGTGLSISSMNGRWNPEARKNNIEGLLLSMLPNLTKLERQMGLGGSLIVDITKHKFETIGMVMNDFGSIRVDKVGKMYNAEILIHTQGVFENKVPTPLIEYVHVDDMPGGNYDLNVCNKYNVQVGAGGMIFKSYGVATFSGTITNIAGSQVNVGSENEINIDGGNRVSIVADVISIRQRDKKQVLIDSSLGVNKNVVIGGGCHVEGELSVNHITAPGEVQITDQTQVYGKAAKDFTGRGAVIGYGVPLYTTEVSSPDGSSITPVSPGILGLPMPGEIVGFVNLPGGCGISSCVVPGVYPVFGSGVPCIQGTSAGYGGFSQAEMPIKIYGTGADNDSIVIAPHVHTFKNIPLTLTSSNDDLRDKAKAVNELERVPANPIDNGGSGI
jgi:hypothetical protein